MPTSTDSGKSIERTRLSWRRTSLTITAVALLAARLGLRERAWLGVVIAALLWVLGLTIIQRRIYVLGTPERLRFRLLATISAITLAFGALGVVLALSRA